MKKTNIATLRSQLSAILGYVKKGKEVEIQKRNITIAKLIPINQATRNNTKLGRGKNTVEFFADVTNPILDDDWEMLK